MLSRKETVVAKTRSGPVIEPGTPHDWNSRELPIELTGRLAIIHVFVLALPAARPRVSSTVYGDCRGQAVVLG